MLNRTRRSFKLKRLLAGLTAALAALGLAASARPGAPAPRNAPTSRPAAAAQIAQGHDFYTQSCAVCHGVGGRGGDGPRLIGLALHDPQIAAAVRDGIPGAMPAFGQKYQPAQAQAIVAYIRSLKK